MQFQRLAPLTVVTFLLSPPALPLWGNEYNPATDETTLRSAGIATDGTALLEYFRKRTLSDADLARMAETVRRLGDANYEIRERASADLLAAGRGAMPVLQAGLTDPDLEIVRRCQRCLAAIERSWEPAVTSAIVRLVGVRRPEDASRVLLDYLPFASDEMVEEEIVAVLRAVGVHEARAEAVLVGALHDRQPIRRAVAALVVGRCRDGEQQAAVRKLLADPEARVRLRAAQGLIGGGDRQAIGVLVALLSEALLELAWQAEELLCRLAGDQAPPVSVQTTNADDRRKCRAAWEDWWRDQGTRLDLAELDLEGGLLGLTLVVGYDSFGARGRIWEMGPDGKPRWQIDAAVNPIDAQVLSNNRVLIAEHGGRKVTERNFKGDVLWEFTANENVHSCQRLANGNVFLASYGHVMEVTRDRKLVFDYPCAGGQSFSAQKLRNGHIVYLVSGGKLVELDERGKDVRTLNVGQATGWATVEALPGGRFLIAQGNGSKVVEFDAEGKQVWQCTSVANPNAAARLPNGNTLICSNNDRQIAEVNRAGQLVWERKLEGRPFRIRRR